MPPRGRPTPSLRKLAGVPRRPYSTLQGLVLVSAGAALVFVPW